MWYLICSIGGGMVNSCTALHQRVQPWIEIWSISSESRTFHILSLTAASYVAPLHSEILLWGVEPHYKRQWMGMLANAAFAVLPVNRSCLSWKLTWGILRWWKGLLTVHYLCIRGSAAGTWTLVVGSSPSAFESFFIVPSSHSNSWIGHP